MAPAKKESTVFIRNRRPNIVIINYAGQRFALQRRGHREDSVSLPVDALNDTTISKFLKQGRLEKISQDSFMRLGARQIDIEASEYLKRPVRDGKRADLIMYPADSDTTRSPSSIRDADIRKSATPNLEWNGELMTTEEELEELDYSAPEHNYPSHHRENDEAVRRQMGF